MDDFRNIEEIPARYQGIFADYPCFNAVQSKVFDDVLYTDKSVVISSPTGSGKTAVFELAITRLLIKCENLDNSQTFKVVYISPIKSLCQERLTDWHKKFSHFGLNCISVTGDSNYIDFQHLINHNLIISTPEKWDSLTRKWRENEKIVKVVKLFMIDEVHLLNEDNRGSTLEVIVSRMKTIENSLLSCTKEGDIYNQKIRFVALSATVPNVEDIAEWIGKPPNITFYRFSEEMRPVKLKKVVLGYNYNPKTTSPFKFDISLSYKLQALMMQYSEGKPTLIFCSTRKSVEMTASHIVQTLRIQLNKEQRQKLLDVANMISDAKPRDTIRHGVGYHHAGMITETRHAIENLFRSGDLPVLVTTSTLAMGVNLPAHLVIIKSTKCYDVNGFKDYTETALHQMIGRAGRPQFDTSATALILTTSEDKEKFEKMVGCGQPIESNLHKHLIEHLNAEVVLRTITDLDVAMQWLASTFLYVRARKNPRYYGLNVGLGKDQIDKKLLEMCQIDLNKLVKVGMLSIDQNIVITPTTTGQIMARYYVAFKTMKLFTQITGNEILIQILALISKCHEFSDIRLRVNDKKTLNLLNKNAQKNTIRFPLNGKIKSWDMKVNCIIQAILGNLDIPDHSILSESFSIMRNGERIAKGLIEYLGTRTNFYSALLNTITLCKCFHAKLWENSPYISKQLSGIGSVMSSQLVNAGKTTFQKILESNPRDIEMIIKRKAPMGNILLDEVRHIPTYRMDLEKVNSRQLKLTIVLENADDLREKSTVPVTSIMTLLLGNDLNEILLYKRYQHSYMIENNQIEKFIDLNAQNSEVTAHFISEDWVGFDCVSTVEFDLAKTGKNQEAKGTIDKKEPTYIQMFLDMYMKTKKKPTAAVTNKQKQKSIDKVAKGKCSKEVCKSTTSGQETNDEVTEINKCADPEKATDARQNNSKKNSNKIHFLKDKHSADDYRNKSKSDEMSTEGNNTYTKSDQNTKITKTVNNVKNTVEEEDELLETLDLAELEKSFEEPLEDLYLNDVKNQNEFVDPEEPESNATNDENTSSTSLFSNEANSIFTNHLDKICEAENDVKLCEETEKETDLAYGCEEQEEADKPSQKCAENQAQKDKTIINFDNALVKAPSVFHISQKYVTDEYVEEKSAKKSAGIKFKFSKKKQMGGRPALVFQNKEDSKRKHLEVFKFPNKKRLHHRPDLEDLPDSTEDNKHYAITEILEPSRGEKAKFESDFESSKDDRNKENLQKSITWRSPLVFSPAVKFSPKISFQNSSISRDDTEIDNQNEITNETFETLDSTKSTANLSLNISQNPLLSGSVKKLTKKPRGTRFPLRDGDYEDSPSKKKKSEDETFDICSTSFLEKLGFPENQNENRRQVKKSEPSVVMDYYSQLLSRPIQAQKQNVDGVSMSQKSPGRKLSQSNECGQNDRDNEACLDVGDKNSEDHRDVSETSNHDISQRLAHENRETFRNNAQYPERCSQSGFLEDNENFPPRFSQENRPLLQTREAFRNVTQCSERFPRNFILAQNRPACCSNYSCSQSDLNRTLDHPRTLPVQRHLNTSIYSDRHPSDHSRDFYNQHRSYANIPEHFDVDIPRCDCNCIPQHVPNTYPRVLKPSNCYNVHSSDDFPPMCRDDFPHHYSSQYFPRRQTFDYNPARSIVRHNSSQTFPEIEEDFPCSQENHPPLDITLNDNVQCEAVVMKTIPRQRSFEERLSDENLRNVEQGRIEDILPSSRHQYVNRQHDVPRKDRLYHQRMFQRNALDESFSYGDRKIRRPEDATANLLNKSLSFEEDPRRSQIYRSYPNDQPTVKNPTFHQDLDLYEPRFNHPNNYGCQRALNYPNRNFPAENRAPYSENYHFPSTSNNFQAYPPNNDKDFVMNKFLYSLNR